jgi:hypothetical protein
MTEIEKVFEQEKQDALKNLQKEIAKKIKNDYTPEKVGEITGLSLREVISLSDQESRPSTTFEDGYKEGIAYVAKSLLKSGMPIEEVAIHAECSAEELKLLLGSLTE